MNKLHKAVIEGNVEVVQRVLRDNPKDVDTCDDSGWIPVQLAASSGNIEIVELLLQHGAEMDILVAAAIGNIEAATTLLAEGADVNVKDPDDSTALYYAAREGHAEIAKLLLENGADPQIEGDFGMTPIDNAIAAMGLASRPIPPTEKYLEIARLLVARGQKVTLPIAAATGDTETVKTFMENGQDPKVHDTFYINRAPLHYAAVFGQTAVAQILITHGADVNVQDMSWKTPLDFAEEGGYTQFAELLKENGGKLGKDVIPSDR